MTTKPFHQKSSSALLVIDVQKEQFEASTPVYKADQLLQNITLLISKARQEGVPVFFVQHAADSYLKYGSDGWQLHPQMQPIAGEVIIHKRHGNSFEDTNLKDELGNEHKQSCGDRLGHPWLCESYLSGRIGGRIRGCFGRRCP